MNKIHPVVVQGLDGRDLAHEVAGLRYDVAAHFLQWLAREYQMQATADRARGRVQLADQLETLAHGVQAQADIMRDIFALCAPHMKDELSAQPTSSSDT